MANSISKLILVKDELIEMRQKLEEIMKILKELIKNSEKLKRAARNKSKDN